MRIYLQSMLFVITCVLTSVLVPDVITPSKLSFTSTAMAAPHINPEDATSLMLKAQQTIYETNLKRRENGLAPLRWNRELYLAAQWFAEDAVNGRDQTYCGHEDSLGRSPGERYTAFGYRNVHAWGENVICGMTSPKNAVNAWMNSEGHRRNLLHEAYRETAVAYYQDPRSNIGFIAQEFVKDTNYSPAVIENEAPSVENSLVNLYIYDTANGEGFRGMNAATEMMIANDPDFPDASWQPYATETTWQLEEGEGWRTVYVKTRDGLGRTATVFDTVYLGTTIPTETVTLDQACTFQEQLALKRLDVTEWPEIQFSLNWQGDNSDATFQDLTDAGRRVDDADAVGGNAHLLPTSSNGSNIRYWTTSFHKDMELMAYFRVKATNTTTQNIILEISAQGGGVTYGPLEIKGTDFTSPDQYQEFALPIRFNNNPDDPYLIFTMNHTGASEIYIDTITLFTNSIPIAREIDWPVPSGYHRSRGVWARFVQNGEVFSAATELNLFGENANLSVPAFEPVRDDNDDDNSGGSDGTVGGNELNLRVYLPITMR